MKKFAILLLALCLLTVGACAEAAEEINWSDIEATVAEAGWGGGFMELEDLGLKVYVPDALKQVESEDYYAAFTTDDQDFTFVILVEELGYTSLSDFADAIKDSVEELDYETVNGLTGLSYKSEEAGYMSFITDKGYTISFVFTPITDDARLAVAAIIIGSIQAL